MKSTGQYGDSGKNSNILEPEVLPAGEVIPGFGGVVTYKAILSELMRPSRHKAHFSAKQVPEEVVEKVVKNRPLPSVRSDGYRPQNPEEKEAMLRELLYRLYPSMEAFGTNFRILDPNEDTLERLRAEAERDYQSFGMIDQIGIMNREVESFKGMSDLFRLMHDEDLVRPDILIPMRNLPDLFMAVPVWYSYLEGNELSEGISSQTESDPKVPARVRWICDQFPNSEWHDVFQMFNRRLRPLSLFKGDLIPPAILRRMKKATKAFDQVVIMTPYHDVAGKEWGNPNWLRMIDPYVVGFRERLPAAVILGRFSDTGVFPLYHEMVADTMEFLRINKERVKGFNAVENPYWYLNGNRNNCFGKGLGDHLFNQIGKMQKAFDQEILFDWLRGEASLTNSPAVR